MREERAMNYSGTAKLQNSTQMSPAQLHRVFFPILLAIFLPHVSFVAAAEVISCVTASSGQPLTLDDSQINDGYCDCIDTGADEPQTSACSGMEEWPSVLIYPIASDHPLPVFFQCPEQPDVQLPPSRINDDICDCCDGADEDESLGCDDTCADIRKRQAEEKQALQTAYTAGSAVRTKGVAAFVQLQATTAAELETLETVTLRELRDVKQVEAQQVLEGEKKVYAEYRIQRLGQSASIHADLWGGITTAEEWIDFITVACQLAGELSDADQSAKTCLPLRWAGLDSGLAWNAAGQIIDNATSKDVHELLYYNSIATEKVYKVPDMESDRSKTTKGKRRLLHVAADDYYDDEDEEEYYNDDDGYHGHDDGGHNNDSSNDSKDEEGSSKRDELLKAIRATKFSSPRVNLLDNAEAVLAKIKTLMEKETEETKETETMESEVESENEGDTDETFDPALLNSVRRELEDRKKVVEGGLNYAVSAKVLLESVTDVGVLRSLATGIVFYGSLSSFHVYQAIVSAVKGLSMPSLETCSPSQSTPWCPPEFVTNIGKSVPPSVVLEFMGTLCNEGEETAPADPITCLASEDDASGPAIPQLVSNGYNGYYQPEPRETTDPLHSLLEAFYQPDEKESSFKNKATNADESLQSILDEIDATEKKMKGLKDKIGGDDGPEKFGTDGELFSVKDDCFDVEAGKYIYEICMFGKAAQKDIDKPKASGTSLGQWTEATTNIVVDGQGKEYSERVWKWERGAKCWNGPQRSATAYVTCGAETVVLSADEPDTCRYVLRVSSPIACDEEHRQRHNLN